jgi:hypothetical protein
MSSVARIMINGLKQRQKRRRENSVFLSQMYSSSDQEDTKIN